MEVKRVAVLGAGLMGHGIGQVCAQVGKFDVTMRDIEQRFIDNGMKMIQDSLQRFVKKGTMSEGEVKEVLNRIHPTLDLKAAVENADLVIEAVTENPPLKKSVLAEADKYAPPHAIIASNTSSISITEIGAATKRPEKVCGMHFFNPPQLMKLIEIVRGLKKCMPQTFSGLLVAAPISVMLIEEVFEAIIACGGAYLSASASTDFLSGGFSVTASMTKSAFSTAAFRSRVG